MSLYDEVLGIAKEYTGLAAEEFLRRRCSRFGLSHPKDLQKENLEDLAAGIRVTAEAYMSEALARAFVADILRLKEI